MVRGMRPRSCVLLLAALLSAPSPAVAAPATGKKKTAAPAADPSGALPAALQKIEKKYAKASTLSAEFSQVNEIAATQQKKTSRGLILVKRPDKVRWEERDPEQTLLISSGKKVLYYTPPFDEGERGQLIERSTEEVHSRLANALLSGRFSAARDMRILQQSATEFLMVPRKNAAGTVEKATIEIDPATQLIQKVTLQNKGGNRSVISLSKIELGKEIPDEQFTFTPPPETDRIRE